MRADPVLREYLRRAPVTLALWRTLELRALASVTLRPPILDLGCGDGIFGSLLFPEGAEVGLDASVREARLARARGVYRHVLAADIESIPLADESVATVVSNCVMEHVDHLDVALAEIRRVLRPCGTFAFTTPSDRFTEFFFYPRWLDRVGAPSLARRWERFRDEYHHHVNVFPPDVWKQRLLRNGFEIREQRYIVPEAVARHCDLAIASALPAVALRAAVGRWILPARRLTLPILCSMYARFIAQQSPTGGGLLHVAHRPPR